MALEWYVNGDFVWYGFLYGIGMVCECVWYGNGALYAMLYAW